MTKEHRAKSIPINKALQAVLDQVPRSILHDYVFTYQGNWIQEGGIKRSFRTTCKTAKVPYGRAQKDGITFHDIRRTVKTYMFYAGVDKVYRDLILGHSLKGMDVHYLAPSEDALRAAMDNYSDWLDDKIGKADSSNQATEAKYASIQ